MAESIIAGWCQECEGSHLRLWTTHISDTMIEEIFQCQDCRAYWRRVFDIKDGKIVTTQERFFFG